MNKPTQFTVVVCQRHLFRHWAEENPELAGEYRAGRFSRAVCVSSDSDVTKVHGLDVGGVVFYGPHVQLGTATDRIWDLVKRTHALAGAGE